MTWSQRCAFCLGEMELSAYQLNDVRFAKTAKYLITPERHATERQTLCQSGLIYFISR